MKKRASNSNSLSRGFRVVALGGGTGLSTLLRGLKEHVTRRIEDHVSPERPVADLASIVTVTDDGGSSRPLPPQKSHPPPGRHSQLYGSPFEGRSSPGPPLSISLPCGPR